MSALLNSLSANPEKWSNTLKQFVGNLPTNFLSVFDHFMNLALKGLKSLSRKIVSTTVFIFITMENYKEHVNGKGIRTHNHLVRKRILSHLDSLAKWLSVPLRTKWLWVRIPLQSLKLQIWRLF